MSKTKISWTDAVWNPVTGCSPVSEGCRNCYAAREAIRLGRNPNAKIRAAYEGTSEMRGAGKARRAVFTGKVNLLPDRLREPLHWRKPRRVFVNSMSDLFHPDVPFEFIDRVFGVMMAAQQHTFQVLTKRPERMAEYVSERLIGVSPLPNVWLGTSCEDQAAADERIPHLLRMPAAVRFLSCEPLLGPIDFRKVPGFNRVNLSLRDWWVIVGGESGPGARACHIAWIESIIEQCKAAAVPVFVKQLGAMPTLFDRPIGQFLGAVELRDRKGGKMSEWPERLRVREYPR